MASLEIRSFGQRPDSKFWSTTLWKKTLKSPENVFMQTQYFKNCMNFLMYFYDYGSI